MESIKEKVKYIKIKDLKSRYSLSKTKSGIINANDSWLEKYPKYSARSKIYGRHDAVEKYDWKALEDSIKTHGIKNPLEVIEKSGYVGDGNHRLAVLKLLYSPNKKVPCTWIPPSTVWTDREIKKELEFHENEINTLEDGITFQQHTNVGKIIKIY